MGLRVRLTEVVHDEAAVAEPSGGAAEMGAALREREVAPKRRRGAARVRVRVAEREHNRPPRAPLLRGDRRRRGE